MKKIIILFIIILFVLSFIDNILSIDATHEQAQSSGVAFQQPIDFFLLQDCSFSARSSIEMVSSSHFNPLFACTDRDIRIGFLCITANSSQPPVFVHLPAKQFTEPIPPDLSVLSITERKRAKEQFLAATREYQQDSIRFYTERSARITAFSAQVDSLMLLYSNNLSNQTDLFTALQIADKSFNYGTTDVRHILVVVSDGIDSYNRMGTIENKAEVVLVNAGKYKQINIDTVSIIFTTIGQSINYSIQNPSK